MSKSLQNDTGPIGRPLTQATFILNYYFFGLQPYSFKVVNLIIHLICGALIGSLSYLIVLLQPLKRQYAIPIALLSSFLWLIHPLQVSTVLYSVQRMAQLCFMFLLLGCITYVLGRKAQITRSSKGTLLICSAFFIFFPLAILSKENGLLFPWYLLAIEYFILRFHTTPQLRKPLKRFHLVLSSSLLIGALLYYALHFTTYLHTFSEKGFTLLERCMSELRALIFYLELILLPALSKMSLYHDDFLVSKQLDLSVLLSAAGLLICFFSIYWYRRRANLMAFGLSWFFIAHTMESTILPLELFFEHRNYIASFGIVFPLAYYAITFFSSVSPNIKKIGCISGILLLILLGSITHWRVQSWSSPESFLRSTSAFHPHSTRVQIEIANWLLLQGNYQAALAYLEKAQNLAPQNAGIALHQLLVFCRNEWVPTLYYEKSRQQLQTGPITPYVITTLNIMVDNMLKGRCESLDPNQLWDILQLSLQNKSLAYKPKYKAVLLHIAAGIALKQNKITQSKQLLLESFLTYPKRIDPLIQKAYLELQHREINEAKSTLRTIEAHQHFLYSPHEKILELKRYITYYLHGVKNEAKTD